MIHTRFTEDSTPSMSSDSSDKRSSFVFNKKKFKLLEAHLHQRLPIDIVTTVLDILCVSLHFDPNVRTVSADVSARSAQRLRERAASLGVSQYALIGRTFYEAHKESENARKKRSRQLKRIKQNEPSTVVDVS
jgi:hypothetical protein